jgi:hypothetical protein
MALIDRSERILPDSAKGAHPVGRKILKGGSRGNSRGIVSLRGIIYISAHITYIFLHNASDPSGYVIIIIFLDGLFKGVLF